MLSFKQWLISLFFLIFTWPLGFYTSCSQPLDLEQYEEDLSSNDGGREFPTTGNEDEEKDDNLNGGGETGTNEPNNIMFRLEQSYWSDLSTSPNLYWERFSGSFTHYEIQIIDADTKQVVVPWKNVGKVTDYQFRGLSLQRNKSYSAVLRIMDGNQPGTMFYAKSGASTHWVSLIGITDIGVGFSFSCAIVNGGVKCWGAGQYGALGNGSTANQMAPVDVMGLSSNVESLSVGGNHACALIAGGAIRCWGRGSVGQLGNGSQQDQSIPVSVSETEKAISISAGNAHTCGVFEGGKAKCWGGNVSGQLGNATTRNSLRPDLVFGMGSGVLQVFSGVRHTCAVKEGGALSCWGENTYGQLGTGGTTQRLAPVEVLGLQSQVTGVAIGRYSTCAVVNESVKCWGRNHYGQLGNNSSVDSQAPVSTMNLASRVKKIKTDGNLSFCALARGNVYCWGANFGYDLVDSSDLKVLAPQLKLGLSVGVSDIDMGVDNICVLSEGKTKCWGSGTLGQLGRGAPVSAPTLTPENVVGL